MTQTWPSTSPTQPGPAPTPPPRQKPRWYFRPWFWIGLLAGLFGLLLLTIASVAAPPEDVASTPKATTTPAASPATEPPATSPPAPAYDTPKPSDFTLKVKVLEKQNFGSAGSLVTFRIDAGWSKTYDPDKTYEVIYEVRGTEDGPMVNTFTVQGDEYERENEENASTSSVSARLTAKVTSVEEM